MNKPRLLIVATTVGTLQAFLLPFADHFRRLGWRVDAMANGVTMQPECIEAFDHVWEVEWSRRPADPSNLLRAVRQVTKVLTDEQYDLVHVHTPVAAFVTRLAGRSLKPGLKVIYTAHGFHFHPAGSLIRNHAFLALEMVAGRWTDYLVTINHEDHQAARQHRLVPPDRVWYMPGIGVDTGLYNPERVHDTACVRKELGLLPRDRLFLMIAEIIPRKRHRDAVAALARLRRADAHLAIAGDGPLREQVARLAQRLGIAERVHMLGFRKDVPVLIRASVAAVLPSEREGLPRSVMESLSLEVPVIATAIRGVRDLLADDCGLMVAVGDVPGLADAMAWVLDHPEQAQAMGLRGRERVLAGYDLKHVIELHEALYAQALGNRGQMLALTEPQLRTKSPPPSPPTTVAACRTCPSARQGDVVGLRDAAPDRRKHRRLRQL